VAREIAPSPPEKYRLGVYLMKNLDITHSPYIPDMECFLLLFRGVNISFKAGDIHDVQFPGHPPRGRPATSNTSPSR